MNTTTEIKLQYPITTKDGNKLERLCMRRPKVRDQVLALKSEKDSEYEAEIAMFANLCDIDPATVMEMDIKDYRKMQDAYSDFLS